MLIPKEIGDASRITLPGNYTGSTAMSTLHASSSRNC